MNFDKELDARGLNCPLPILRAKKALTDMTTGQVLQDRRHRPGLGEGLPGVLEADRQRAAVARRGEQGVHVLHEAQVTAPAFGRCGG